MDALERICRWQFVGKGFARWLQTGIRSCTKCPFASMCAEGCFTAVQAIWMVDTKGLITKSRGDELPEHKKLFARDDTPDMKARSCPAALNHQRCCQLCSAVYSIHKAEFAELGWQELVDIVNHVKPHALIGLTGHGPAFDEKVVKALCSHVDKPLIFPLSNPTDKAEITAENAFKWSDCKCLFASGQCA